MAGIYLHIPFCKTRCIYCDFYSPPRDDLKRRYVRALCRELRLRRDYLQGAPVETVYFGGGTPSQLDEEDFADIFRTLQETHGLENAVEITLEANPDDLTEACVDTLRRFPFNRISMGVQTFDDSLLHLLRRRHTARQAIEAVERCRRAGFRNLSIDLIYGLPGETKERWQRDLEEAIRLHPEHISAYHLTYEEGTPLHRLLLSHQVREVDEDVSLCFFTQLTHTLKEAGYVHYEISNFAREGYLSRHNSAYWTGKKYLGLGPSAHSYNGREREWNAASLPRWIAGIRTGQLAIEREELSPDTQYNDYIITGLRTMWGICLDEIERRFGAERRQYCAEMAGPHLRRGVLRQEGERLFFSEAGVFVSDGVMSDLLFV